LLRGIEGTKDKTNRGGRRIIASGREAHILEKRGGTTFTGEKGGAHTFEYVDGKEKGQGRI